MKMQATEELLNTDLGLYPAAVVDGLDTGIMGSNLAQCLDISLCSPVHV
jgi:hypothetical protein